MRFRIASICSLWLASLCFGPVAPSEASVDISAYLSRQLASQIDFLDPDTGGGWQRNELFTNISPTETLRIDVVEVLLLNPEDVGFSDIFGVLDGGTTNGFEVVAAAQALFPTWHFFGASWWQDDDLPAIDWDLVERSYSVPVPFLLAPGESFIFTNRNAGFPFGSTDILTGELVIGFRPLGEVVQQASLPEPSTFMMGSLGAIGGAALIRRSSRARISARARGAHDPAGS